MHDWFGYVAFVIPGVRLLMRVSVVSLWSKPRSKIMQDQDPFCFDGKETINIAALAQKSRVVTVFETVDIK